MTSTIITRKAATGDLPALHQFQQGIVAAERPFDMTLCAGAIQYYDLERLLSDTNVELVIAEFAGEPVGCGFARIDFAKPYVKHRKQAYLGLMYVEPRLRGQGVNRQVIRHLQCWCRSKGVRELRLDVYAGNAAAIKAYEKVGFAGHLLEMRVELPAESD